MNNGAWSLSDTLMADVYLGMVEHGLDRVVFVGNGVNDVDDWLKFVKLKQNVLHVIGNENGPDMVAWLNTFGHNFAFGHFCCFPHTWGKTSVELGRQTLQHWFGFGTDDHPLLDVILGQLPTTNRRAVDYIQKIGMTIMGRVPNIRYKGNDKAVGATFAYITREDF
jgi:hypothetical protein